MKKKIERFYTFGEEIGNSVTHGVMALFCLIFIPFASVNTYTAALNNPSVPSAYACGVSVGIFLLSLGLMFMTSTLYHVMNFESAHKRVMRILDHCFIYVAIAGTYTPIALSIIGGWQGWLIFGIQWTMVIVGILYKSLLRFKLPKLSLAIYLIMGWTVVMFFPIFLKNSSTVFSSLIFGGGVFYTVGVYFYNSKWKFSHMVWHLMINLASISHFIAIVFFMV